MRKGPSLHAYPTNLLNPAIRVVGLPEVSKTMFFWRATIDPQSLTSRKTVVLLLFLLGLLSLAIGFAISDDNQLRYPDPDYYDFGTAHWPEQMLLGVVSQPLHRSQHYKANSPLKLFLPFLTSFFFIIRSINSSHALHLGCYFGIECFVFLTLLLVWAASFFFSEFTWDPYPHCWSQYSDTEILCLLGWGAARGIFLTGYAFIMLLTLVSWL